MPAISVHHTATSDAGWDGPANEARLDNDGSESYYRSAYAWRDPDGDAETKAAYKFVHHEVSGEGDVGAANVRACITGIAVLNGARGGTNIPDSDRRGIYNHLAAHIEDADQEPPELRSRAEMGRGADVALAAGLEQRTQPAEMRVDGQGRIEGYAAVFDEWSVELGGFRERIRAGAFAKTIQEADIRATFNHDPNYVLGRNTAGTLELAEDDHGLHFRSDPPKTTWADDLRTSVRRGDVDQGSFVFRTIRDDWQRHEDENRRTLIEVELSDVAVVTYPAYPQTSVQARSQILAINSFLRADQEQVDPVLVRSFIRQLEALLPAAPAEGGHPAEGDGDDSQARIALKRRRLELARKMRL